MSRSKASGGLETERFRQAIYLSWCKLKHIPDPCGPEDGYQRIAGYFIKHLIIQNNCRSATARGYADAINVLFNKREFPIPAEFSDNVNIVAKIIENLSKEEDIARQRSPLTAEIFACLFQLAKNSEQDSETSVIFDWFCVIRIIGLRCSEYAQTTQSKIDIYEYPSGKQVVKAFIRTDWVFHDERGRIIKVHDEAMLDSLGKCRVTFRIQKNRQNGQKITFTFDSKHPSICPVRAAYRIYLRSIRLGQSDDEPMAVFVNKKNAKKYLTGNKIAEILQKAARIAHPDWTDEEISRITSHSGRVWALVLLDEAGKLPTFMKSRLRWLGDSYRLYLRDTAALTNQHNAALDSASAQMLALLGGNLDTLPDIVPFDDEMGDFNERD